MQDVYLIISIVYSDDVFYALPPNVSIVLNGSEIAPLIKVVNEITPNMRELVRFVQALLPRFSNDTDSVDMFNALRILTDTGYIKFRKLVAKKQASTLRQIWRHLEPVKFDNSIARDAAVLDAVDTFRWLPRPSFDRMWPGNPTLSMAFPHSFELPCKVEGAEQAQWFHNGRRIGSFPHHRRIIKDDGSLWIGNARPSDAGLYRCDILMTTGLVSASAVVSVTATKGTICRSVENIIVTIVYIRCFINEY